MGNKGWWHDRRRLKNNDCLFVFHYHPFFHPHVKCAKHVGHRIFCKDCACERLCTGDLYECGASPSLAGLMRGHLNPRPARNAWATESFAKTAVAKGFARELVRMRCLAEPRRAHAQPLVSKAPWDFTALRTQVAADKTIIMLRASNLKTCFGNPRP